MSFIPLVSEFVQLVRVLVLNWSCLVSTHLQSLLHKPQTEKAEEWKGPNPAALFLQIGGNLGRWASFSVRFPHDAWSANISRREESTAETMNHLKRFN